MKKGNDLTRAAWRRVVAKGLPPELQGYAREWAESVERLELEGTDSAARLEHDLWRSLCDALTEAGAVTAADLKASVHDSETPGCQLLLALRTWGDVRRANTSESVACAFCGKVVLFVDSYSPADEAICAACNAEVKRERPRQLRDSKGRFTSHGGDQ